MALGQFPCLRASIGSMRN